MRPRVLRMPLGKLLSRLGSTTIPSALGVLDRQWSVLLAHCSEGICWVGVLSAALHHIPAVHRVVSYRLGLPLCRPSHPRLDELGDFGDLAADFAALAAAGLWQVHVGSLPRTCSGLRLQKRAVLLAGGDRGGGLFNVTHRRHHGPRPKAHPPNTDAREIRDFGNTLRHHDVDRQRRE